LREKGSETSPVSLGQWLPLQPLLLLLLHVTAAARLSNYLNLLSAAHHRLTMMPAMIVTKLRTFASISKPLIRPLHIFVHIRPR
jgi:hypothetical protein